MRANTLKTVLSFFLVLAVLFILLIACQPIFVEIECYPPLFIGVFIDENDGALLTQTQLDGFNNFPIGLHQSSNFILFEVDPYGVNKSNLPANLIDTQVTRGIGGQKSELEKQFADFCTKNNLTTDQTTDFYLYFCIDDSGSMSVGDVPDVAAWVASVDTSYDGANIINTTSNSGEQWMDWIIQGVSEYAVLIPGDHNL